MFSPFGLPNAASHQILTASSTAILVEDADRNVNFLRPVVAPPTAAAFTLPLLTTPIVDSRRSSIVSAVSDSELPFDRSRPLPSSTLNAMKVYLRNIPGCVSEEDVQRFAEGYGAVRKVERSRERGGTTHCCYVTFESTVAASECVRTANGTTYFVQLAMSRGFSGTLPTATVRMAESMEERKERLARKEQGGITGASSALPPPPPYVHSYIASPAQPPISTPISTASITLQHLHPNVQPAPTAPTAPLVYIIIPPQ